MAYVARWPLASYDILDCILLPPCPPPLHSVGLTDYRSSRPSVHNGNKASKPQHGTWSLSSPRDDAPFAVCFWGKPEWVSTKKGRLKMSGVSENMSVWFELKELLSWINELWVTKVAVTKLPFFCFWHPNKRRIHDSLAWNILKPNRSFTSFTFEI